MHATKVPTTWNHCSRSDALKFRKLCQYIQGHEGTNTKGCVYKNTRLLAALFTKVILWKQPECPATGDWVKKLGEIYSKGHYFVITKQKMELHHLEQNRGIGGDNASEVSKEVKDNY